MVDEPKRRATHSRKEQSLRLSRVFQQFQCDEASYDFELPIDLFNSKEFFKATGVKVNERWETVIEAKNHRTGYHVHFKGRIKGQNARLTIEYWDGAIDRAQGEKEPFAESIMQWLGSFVRPPSARAFVMVRFEKPTNLWKSRFNLPFKVTMSDDVEVTIDGVSLVLPKNKFGAVSGFLARSEQVLHVSVQLARPVEFATFDIRKEINRFNESIKMFVEPVEI